MTVKIFVKGESKKYLDKDSKLIPVVLADGWKEEKAAPKKAPKKKED